MKKNVLLPLFLFLYFTHLNAQLSVDAGADQSVCFGLTVTLGGNPTASGGTPPYTYVWKKNNVTFSTQANPSVSTFTGTNTLVVTVTDGLGATASDSVVVTITPVVSLNVTANQTSTLCGAYPQILFSSAVSGGTQPYTYSWDFDDGQGSTVPNPSHLFTFADTYDVSLLVTDAQGCADEDWITITIQAAPIANGITTSVLCFGGNTGSIDLFPSSTAPTFTFTWSNGSITEDQTNLSAGTYQVTVTDGNGCSVSNSFNVAQPTPLTVVANPTPQSAPNVCDGSIVASVTGGTPPYTYVWSNSSTSQVMQGLCPGVYTATITDANGCTATVQGTVAASCPNNTLVVTLSSQDLGCGNPTSTLSPNVSGGNAPYSFLWSTGETTSAITVNQADVYTVWVADSAGCTQTASDTVLNNGVDIQVQNITNAACNGIANGGIKVNVTGGTPPYTYLWSNNATTDSIGALAAGVYTLTVSDAVQCSATLTQYINNGNNIWTYYVYVNSATANCSNNGSATALVSGGAGPYTYLWNTTPPQTTATATGLTAGNYTVSVTDSSGCIRTGNTYVGTSCYNVITGRLINDLNGNCQLDAGETPFAGRSVIADGVTDYYGTTNAQGYFQIKTIAGSYNVRPITINSCEVFCSGGNTSYNHTFPGLGDTVANNNFYLVVPDVNLFTLITSGAFRPGFNQTVYIYYGNKGTDTTAGTLTFTYDSDLTFVSAGNNPVAHNTTTRTITWNLASITPNLSSYVYQNYVSVTFLTPIGTPINTPITTEAHLNGILPDCDTTDNHDSETRFVTNSYDPNEKQVLPAGDIQEEDSVLTYTIHFQNTGNDTAWFVVLKDTLSAHLEPGTVENIGWSHSITEFKAEGEGILTWVFNPIYLVDSATNPEGSKGYVTFRIKKKAGLPLNTEIKNKASIYFDYNEAIVTNTVSSKLTDPNSIYNLNNDNSISVTAAPNPFTNATLISVEGITTAYHFQLFDVSGKLLKDLPSLHENRFVLQRDNMSPGVYFYSITTASKQKVFGRLVVQ